MIPLPKRFTQSGFHFHVLKRKGPWVMLEKTRCHATDCAKVHFEVVKIQHFKERTFPNGITVPAHEILPSSEQWGIYGWTPIDRERAEELFAEKCRED